MSVLGGIDTRAIGDTGSSVVVLVVAVGLVLLGSSLAALTVWFWRSTHPDPEALGPLLVMSKRGFVEQTPVERRRLVDVARPGGSVDFEISIVPVDESTDESAPEIDEQTSEVSVDSFVDTPEFVQEMEPVETAEPVVVEFNVLNRPIDPLLGR